MRISDWSSDVCSSDLPCEYDGDPLRIGFNGAYLLDVLRHLKGTDAEGTRARVLLADPAAPTLWQQSDDAKRLYVLMPMRVKAMRSTSAARTPIRITRSEEHTSELQSLMRISYAVFCLKKQNNQ